MATFVNGSGQNEQYFQRTFHRYFLPRFGSFGQAFQSRIFFRNRQITNKNCLWWPYLSIDQDEISNLYRGSPIDDSCEVSVHLANWFQLLTKFWLMRQSVSETKKFRNQSIRHKHFLWWHACKWIRTK